MVKIVNNSKLFTIFEKNLFQTQHIVEALLSNSDNYYLCAFGKKFNFIQEGTLPSVYYLKVTYIQEGKLKNNIRKTSSSNLAHFILVLKSSAVFIPFLSTCFILQRKKSSIIALHSLVLTGKSKFRFDELHYFMTEVNPLSGNDAIWRH